MGKQGEQRLNVSEVDDVTVVHFRDQRIWEDLVVQEIRRELLAVVNDDGVERVLLNLSSVSFASSPFFQALIDFDKKAKKKGVIVTLCSIRPEVYEVFAITRLDKLFNIRRDESDGLGSF